MPHVDREAARKYQREYRRKNHDRTRELRKRFEESLKKQGTSSWKRYSKGKTDESTKKRIYRYGEDAVARLQATTACDLCGASGVKLVVDHCHHTSVTRGILCNRCNIGLGMLQDNPELIRRAADYLESSSTKSAVA